MAAMQQQNLGHAQLGRHDNFVHGACMVIERELPIIIEGKLCKKSKWRGRWRVRRCELHQNKAMHIFVNNKHRSVIDLGDGALVRQINDVGYGRKFSIRDAKGTVIQLEASNVETRDMWTYHIQRVIQGIAGQPEPQQQQQQEQPFLDVAVPPGLPPEGGTISLKLTDGRQLQVPVPAGAVPGQLMRIPIPPAPAPRASMTTAPVYPDDDRDVGKMVVMTDPARSDSLPVAVAISSNGWDEGRAAAAAQNNSQPIDDDDDEDLPVSSKMMGCSRSFMDMTGANPRTAEIYLDMSGGHVEAAVELYKGMGEQQADLSGAPDEKRLQNI